MTVKNPLLMSKSELLSMTRDSPFTPLHGAKEWGSEHLIRAGLEDRESESYFVAPTKKNSGSRLFQKPRRLMHQILSGLEIDRRTMVLDSMKSQLGRDVAEECLRCRSANLEVGENTLERTLTMTLRCGMEDRQCHHDVVRAPVKPRGKARIAKALTEKTPVAENKEPDMSIDRGQDFGSW
jgi:hypothetical protein